MKLRFLVDAQLPPALARWIAARGYEALHTNDIGLNLAKDGAIWREAIQRGSVIITKDEDFVVIRRREPFPQVVWIRWGNTSRNVLLERMADVFPQIVAAPEAGETVVEVR